MEIGLIFMYCPYILQPCCTDLLCVCVCEFFEFFYMDNHVIFELGEYYFFLSRLYAFYFFLS
jgi:hypothetical protein